jgi:hypothetical protein
MKTCFTNVSSAAVLISVCLTVRVFAEEPNSLSDQEQKDGFKLLFDGEGLDDWKHAGNWLVEEGAITRTGKGGSLVYRTTPIPDEFIIGLVSMNTRSWTTRSTLTVRTHVPVPLHCTSAWPPATTQRIRLANGIPAK